MKIFASLNNNILKEKIDYIILIISPKIRNGINALNEIDIDFEILHENYIGEEKIVFDVANTYVDYAFVPLFSSYKSKQKESEN